MQTRKEVLRANGSKRANDRFLGRINMPAYTVIVDESLTDDLRFLARVDETTGERRKCADKTARRSAMNVSREQPAFGDGTVLGALGIEGRRHGHPGPGQSARDLPQRNLKFSSSKIGTRN